MTQGPQSVRLLTLPDEITPELQDILGTMCFEVSLLAQVFRLAGRPIAKKAEAEQAFCIHWFLTLHADHGARWREVAAEEIKAIQQSLRDEAEAVKTACAATGPKDAGHG